MTAIPTLQRAARRIGVNPWNIRISESWMLARATEQAPVSRFRFGSPCRFIRSIDFAVHVLLPQALEQKYPELATYLRSTSPRWGRTFREW